MKTPSITDDAEFAQIEQRQRALAAAKAALVRERDQVHQELEERRARGMWSSTATDGAVRALIAGESPVEAGAQKNLLERSIKLAEQIDLHERALRMLYADKEAARQKASRRLCAQIRPVQLELAKAVVVAARALAQAMHAQADYIAQLERGGIQTGPLFVPVPAALGREDEFDSPITRLVIDAVREGCISTEEASPAARTRLRPRPVPAPIPLAERSPRTKHIAGGPFYCGWDGLYDELPDGALQRVSTW